MDGYTVFTSYVLVPVINGASGYTYSQGIHCNYINSLQFLTSPEVQEINMYFSEALEDFKFLNSDISSGTGFTAHKIYALIQVISNANYSSLADVKPIASGWTYIDITNQVVGHIAGNLLTRTELQNTIFKIPLSGYTSFSAYTLSYLNYPSALPVADDELCFGDEIYFFGNVTTEIHADVFTTDLSVSLLLNEFNSSTNATWDGVSSVAISEVGIYDINKNLVAVGKLNDPITKDSTISRTIVFDIDF